MASFRFPKEERLRGEANIKAVFKKGLKFSCNGATLFILQNGLKYNRFLCTFRRGFGSAVMRNRSRRISKEAYRQIKNKLKSGYDFILLVSSYETDFYTNSLRLDSLFKFAKMYN